ncbi:MAG: DUF2726 domain-containing protein [Deltaproteobacteria bacterium]|nr:DUF2726 domain-containing protein [Deltaproteobacteria bacterium]
MYWPFLVFIVVGFFLVIGLRKILRFGPGRSSEFSYIKNRALFSPAERALFLVLHQAVGKDYWIFGKVRVADVVAVRATNNRSAWHSAFSRIAAKHFDFVLCAKDDLAIRCAVELNDRSHESPRRRKRDVFLEDVCKRIALPLVQIKARSEYSASDLQKIVLAALRGDSEIKAIESEHQFSVGLMIDSKSDDRPWTIA